MAININDISYKYGKSLVLDNLSFQIEESHITGIYGSNGSGKSTIAKMLANLISPNSGYINSLEFNINNKTKNNVKYKKRIGYLPQKITTYFKAENLDEELKFILKNNNYTNEFIKNRIDEICKTFNINTKFLNKKIDALNMSEKRIAAFVCSVINNPDLIILDEPFIGIDINYKKIIINYLKEIKNENKKTVVIFSNNIDSLLKIVDDLVIIKDGKHIISGKKNDVITNVDIFAKNEIQMPEIIEFSKNVKDKKNIKIGYYDDVKDLMKAVYRNV